METLNKLESAWDALVRQAGESLLEASTSMLSREDPSLSATRRRPPTIPPRPSAPPPRVLVADDDERVQRAVGRVGIRHGYDMIPVTRGGDVLETAAAAKPELIVLDVSFPDADGRDILARLKADPRTADVPVLVWSGTTLNREWNRKIALDLGAADYVEKVDTQTFVCKVKRVLFRLE